MQQIRYWAMIVAFAAIASGCAQDMKRESLEAVAKDWCMTIRASRVIPVYPLTEDLQPGDIFLVQLPVKRQHEIYEQKGFLPLDNHLHRLTFTGPRTSPVQMLGSNGCFNCFPLSTTTDILLGVDHGNVQPAANQEGNSTPNGLEDGQRLTGHWSFRGGCNSPANGDAY